MIKFVGLAVGSLGLLTACATWGGGAGPQTVELRETSYGLPHIKAETFEGAGYGLGYAFAEDNLCVMADWFTTLRGERSLHFGADETYREVFLAFNGGQPPTNFKSDVFYRYMYADESVAEVKAAASADVRGLVKGFTAGYNRYLADTPVEERPDACADAAWAGSIEEQDVWRRAYHFTLLESINLLSMPIVNAAPPATGGEEAALSAPKVHADIGLVRRPAAGSNAIAWGSEATTNGKGLVFGNPHFPWSGRERQYAAQLTVGDDYDVFGSFIYGVPVPLLGFNEDVAWSITYSTDQRMALMALDLVAGDPTRYLVDGVEKEMSQVVVSVPVAGEDGALTTRTHTVWETEFGPLLSGGPLQWTADTAYTVLDANRINYTMMDQYVAMSKAEDVGEFQDALATLMSAQFSNAVAADRDGNAFFGNYSVAVDIPNDRIDACVNSDIAKAMLANFNVLLVDGSQSQCHPITQADAPRAGTIPARQRPSVLRDDYVFQANDSYWAVNADPESFFEGFHRTIGDEQTPRGERFREGVRLIEERLAAGEKFDIAAVQDFFNAATNKTGREIQASLVRYCSDRSVAEPIDAACTALSHWDGTSTIDARGAMLMRLIMDKLPRKFAAYYVLSDPTLWKTPFDPADPVTTPRDFIMTPAALQAVTAAVEEMQAKGLALDAPLGEQQFLIVDGEQVGAFGNPYTLNLFRSSWDADLGGYSEPVNIGNSFTHIVQFTEDGLDAKFILSYSQSTDPASPHARDQLALYLNQEWIDLPFTEDEIEADPGYQVRTFTLGE